MHQSQVNENQTDNGDVMWPRPPTHMPDYAEACLQALAAEIGLSETVLHGRSSGPEWHYLNPFIPYYWEQYNNWRDDNIYMGADFVWWPFEGTRTYGELMIDDFQIDFVSEPHQYGFDLGVSKLGLADFKRLRADLQYTHIRNYVYGQARPYNIFTNEGVIIGSSLGPDSDRFRYSTGYAASPDITVTAGGAFTRKGEGRVTDRQDMLLPKHKNFPSGTVEKKLLNYIRFSYLHGFAFDLQIEAGYYHISNLANTCEKLDSPYVNIFIQYDFQRWLKL